MDSRYLERYERIKPLILGVKPEDLSCDGEILGFLRFLYAYMPVSDLASYSCDVFADFASHAAFLKKQMPWCQNLPDSIFYNYVLHYRVNNENIEPCRRYLHDEIAPRLGGFNAEKAALEVNHWCAERARYTSTDIRTASPMTVLRAARGRCGEESVLAVSALRAVGIPARQVYTPRWPHCDSNHAWVEVYVSGTWKYLGACEPEPELNRGWFAKPASRVMLAHSRVFSLVPPPGEIESQSEIIAEMNLTADYTKVKKLTVRVENQSEKPIIIRFELPNSAELYPIAILTADICGEAGLTTGIGDLLIHATDGERYIEAFAAANETLITLDFSKAIDYGSEPQEYLFVPPEPMREDDPLINDHNFTYRLKTGEGLREKIETGFLSESEARAITTNLGYKNCTEKLLAARGNYPEIVEFLKAPVFLPPDDDKKYKQALLNVLHDKDMTDCTADVLISHLESAYTHAGRYPDEVFVHGILNPRAYTEPLRVYREELFSVYGNRSEGYAENPRLLWKSIDEDIKEAPDYSTLCAHSPGVAAIGLGSELSKRVLFVHAARSLGIPTRLGAYDYEPEYWNGDWRRVKDGTACFAIRILSDSRARYFGNFTLARLVDGIYKTLLSGVEDTALDGIDEIVAPQGHYRITTALRLPDCSVALRNEYFYHGNYTEIRLTFPNPPAVQDGTSLAFTLDLSDGERDIRSILPSGGMFAFILSGNEPSVHILSELASLGETGISTAVFSPSFSAEDMRYIKAAGAEYYQLRTDKLNPALVKLAGTDSYPVLIAVDAEFKVRYTAAGYRAGSVSAAAGAQQRGRIGYEMDSCAP